MSNCCSSTFELLPKFESSGIVMVTVSLISAADRVVKIQLAASETQLIESRRSGHILSCWEAMCRQE